MSIDYGPDVEGAPKMTWEVLERMHVFMTSTPNMSQNTIKRANYLAKSMYTALEKYMKTPSQETRYALAAHMDYIGEFLEYTPVLYQNVDLIFGEH